MALLFNILIGLAAVTALALVTAFGGWYYSLRNYDHLMSRRAYLALKFLAPPFMLVAASPLVDVVIWLNGGGFPTIGFRGLAVGLVGSGAVFGYVIFDTREELLPEDTAAEPDAGSD